ncbi:hypothetical protein CERSUDRAFT_102868 [Gelatoporia subvermispora B]|uniref:Protein-S-isoprenylcysteine O-methyltransferase n=1 Tax=Ceriporiopsis subvermispora (strain B) TaxID=914234 RepID=M2PUQ8_CERS8|nr:hypothetical protein CERSUDRAFT_102868 [Gelatoporia subvermispora B]
MSSSDVQPLLKAALIFTGAAAAHRAFTAPNPPPPEEEQEKYKGTILLTFHQSCFWTISLCEIAAIFSSQFPSPVSNDLLSALVTSPAEASRIRLTETFIAGWSFIVAGCLLRLACYRTLGRHFTFQLSVRKDHKLVTDGPYGIVRHPSYTGALLATVGILMCALSRGSWLRESSFMDHTAGRWAVYTWVACKLAASVVICILRIPKEDGVMRKQFGTQWDDWAKKTPYRLFPGFF